MRSRSFSTTARGSRPSSSARIRRPTSRSCESSLTSRSRQSSSASRRSCAWANGSSPSATRSASAAPSLRASSRRATATSMQALTTTISRRTPPSTVAIPAVPSSTWTARSWASTPPSYRRPAARSESALPATTAVPVIDQLRQFGETRRGWLGVRIQQVTDEIAESLNIKPPRGALVAGGDDKGPAKPSGIEPGDVIVKFDGKEIKEMRDLPRVVADTPVGKQTPVVVIRKGKEETKTVTLGRLEDGEKLAAADPKDGGATDKPVVKKTLGLEPANH